MLFNPATAIYGDFWLKPFKAAAASHSMEAIEAPVRDMSNLEVVIANQAREPNTGIVVMPDSFTDAHRAEIAPEVLRCRAMSQCDRRPVPLKSQQCARGAVTAGLHRFRRP